MSKIITTAVIMKIVIIIKMIMRIKIGNNKNIFFVQMYLLASTTNDASIFQRFSKILFNRIMKEGCKISRL